ncbi:hypothetical protein L6164_028867 [Bauhinia variegata]|uniref:Uncharacterized protein n=1 Tax=Bauhinia variegata TaxID=167791 RepID=A0ACB9L7H0_BAUVA|nr:hypothetical protein L6164_028867 [Bauhinia variegata]
MKYTKKPRIILVPYPAQGHVNPMQKLALTLISHGFEPVIVLPQYIHHKIVPHVESQDDQIEWISVPDGLEKDTTPDFFAAEFAMENSMPSHLESMVHEFEDDGGVVCLVVDLLASWAIEVATRCGVPAAGFWPAMFATYRLIAAVPDMIRSGLISDSGFPQHQGEVCFLPDFPILSTEDLPWLIGTTAAKKARFKFWKRTMERSRNLKWLLVNSFPNEGKSESQIHLVTKDSQETPHVLPIAPLFKQNYIANTPTFWEEDLSCLEWLDTQNPNSVLYISFGSWVSPIGEAKVKSLAMALEASRRPFIWVLKSNWQDGLPIGFLGRVSKQGKVVSWAPQLAVLQHESVGCYLTHCGWNSTMEAIQFRKRLLCYPVAGDQFVNCAYIVQEWRVGLRLNGFSEKDLEEGLCRVMEDMEMESTLRKLSERIMGKEECSRVAFNMKGFVEDIKKEASSF